jgi:hypothetical protein
VTCEAVIWCFPLSAAEMIHMFVCHEKNATIMLKILDATIKKLSAQALEICLLLKLRAVNAKLSKL